MTDYGHAVAFRKSLTPQVGAWLRERFRSYATASESSQKQSVFCVAWGGALHDRVRSYSGIQEIPGSAGQGMAARTISFVCYCFGVFGNVAAFCVGCGPEHCLTE